MDGNLKLLETTLPPKRKRVNKPAKDHPWKRQPGSLRGRASREAGAAANNVATRLTCPVEADEQKALFQWARSQEKLRPELKMMFHVANGAYCSEMGRLRLVSEGLRAGVPDVLLPVARGCYHGLAIEMKRVQGGTLKVEQALWLRAFREEGWYSLVCYGAGHAIDVITKYLNLGEFVADGASMELPSPDAVGDFFKKLERRTA
jgi:hypothetical protein